MFGCNGLQWFAMVCKTLQRFAILCNGLQWFEMICYDMQWYANAMVCRGLQYLARVYKACNGLQGFAILCNDLQWFAMICNFCYRCIYPNILYRMVEGLLWLYQRMDINKLYISNILYRMVEGLLWLYLRMDINKWMLWTEIRTRGYQLQAELW